MTPDDPQPKKGPAYTARAGKLVARAWANPDRDGKTWYSVTLDREFAGEDGKVHHAKSFGVNDLLPAARLLDEVWRWAALDPQ